MAKRKSKSKPKSKRSAPKSRAKSKSRANPASKPRRIRNRSARRSVLRGADRRDLSRSEIDAALRASLANQKSQASRAKALEPRLFDALERAQTEAAKVGYASTLKVVRPPQKNVDEDGRNFDGKFTWQTPWAVVARFTWRDVVGYDELWEIFESWSKRAVTRDPGEINKHRWARIKIIYVDHGEALDYTLSESAPWAVCLERAQNECDPEDTETVKRGGYVGSLASRYGLVRDNDGNLVKGSIIRSVYVWLSAEKTNNLMRN